MQIYTWQVPQNHDHAEADDVKSGVKKKLITMELPKDLHRSSVNVDSPGRLVILLC